MLITFKSSAYADIIMFGDVGLKLLDMMGFGRTVPGAVGAADVPRALRNLEQGLEQLTQPEPAVDAEDEPPIDLHTRALPLLELLRATATAEKAVRWE